MVIGALNGDKGYAICTKLFLTWYKIALQIQRFHQATWVFTVLHATMGHI